MSMNALKIRTTEAPRAWTPWGSIPVVPSAAPSAKSRRDARARWLKKAAKRDKT